MRLPCKSKFVDEKQKKAFYKLQAGDGAERDLFQQIDGAMDKIEIDAFCGIQIPKRLIPKGYGDIKNLWKLNLNDGWRLMYCIASDDSATVSVILEWLDHKEYERRFGY